MMLMMMMMMLMMMMMMMMMMVVIIEGTHIAWCESSVRLNTEGDDDCMHAPSTRCCSCTRGPDTGELIIVMMMLMMTTFS